MKSKIFRIFGGLAIVGVFFFGTLFVLDFLDKAPRNAARVETTKPVSSSPLVIFTISPKEMRSCEPARVARISWNAKQAGAGSVKIYVLAAGKENPFADGTPEGSADTGLWAGAGLSLVLRDGGTGKELARTAITLQPGIC